MVTFAGKGAYPFRSGYQRMSDAVFPFSSRWTAADATSFPSQSRPCEGITWPRAWRLATWQSHGAGLIWRTHSALCGSSRGESECKQHTAEPPPPQPPTTAKINNNRERRRQSPKSSLFKLFFAMAAGTLKWRVVPGGFRRGRGGHASVQARHLAEFHRLSLPYTVPPRQTRNPRNCHISLFFFFFFVCVFVCVSPVFS